MPTEQAEALHLQRFEALRQAARSGAGLDSYDPLEAVPGAARVTPLPVAARPTIAVDALAKAGAVAGAANSQAFMVWRRGKVEAASFFNGADVSTPIVSRSLAKPVTALLIGRALALGKITSLDQPVADFITEWQGTPKATMRIRHLLDMRTGLLPQDFSMDPQHILNRAYLHPNHEAIIINDYPLVDPPGTRYEYSNATSELVAIVLERATGVRYAEFLSRELLQKVGAAGGELWVNRPGGMAHSGCCLMLPAESWLRLAVLVAQDGRWNGQRLLPRGYVKEMATGTAEYPYYGLGVYVGGRYIERRGFANPARNAPKVLHSEPYLTDDFILFDGNANQVIFISPSQQLVILRVGRNPPRQPEWDNATFANTILRGLPQRDQRRLTAQPR
jgi:CubicO group peptidase (beta-lactamase class C family)